MKRIHYLLMALAVIVTDALTKWVVSTTIDLHASVPVISGFFDIVHVRNRGAAFGIGANAESVIVPLLLNGGAIVVFVTVVVYSFRTAASDRLPQIGLHLILGGAIGNLIDRLRFGYVVDFLDVYVRDHHWPAFNVADSAIVVGICLLFLDMKRRPEAEGSRTALSRQHAGTKDE